MAQIGRREFDAIRWAIGGDLNALDAVMTGRVKNAFCLQRPPAAHAESESGYGFCIVNNFNIVAQRVCEAYGVRRILIADCTTITRKALKLSGTARTAYSTRKCVKRNALEENGDADRRADMTSAGKGTGLNVPMPAGAGNAAYIKAFKEVIEPIAGAYEPELVILMAGFASSCFDPLCRQRLTAERIWGTARIVQGIADRHAGARCFLPFWREERGIA